jgi:2-oxo-4-hydroxy-4-carboxy-5-ureidoimidazoline decarboxylase
VTDPAAFLDSMSEDDARAALSRCCGASRWVSRMLALRPFGDREALVRAAREAWATMERADVLEAFDHHPRIGADMAALRERFAATEAWSAGEQKSVAAASEETLRRLRDGNLAYERRYGHIFIVCATGKSADEMLSLLESRMNHEPDEELAIAAGEQMKITEIRLDKLGAEP